MCMGALFLFSNFLCTVIGECSSQLMIGGGGHADSWLAVAKDHY